MNKAGFRIKVAKNDFSSSIELLNTGSLCSKAESGQTTLVCFGEVIGENNPLSAEEVLQKYLREGVSFVNELDGAYVLVFLGEWTKPTVVLTDRLNAVKCFVEETDDSHYLASSLCFLPKTQRQLDPIGVTSFLANGVIYCNRTVFDGVRSLQRACIYTFSPTEGITSRQYWNYQFDNSFAGRKRADLKSELAELLMKAAKKRVGSNEKIQLSLSGGYDSTCILGLLSKIQPPGGVECFSYIVDAGSSGSDESVAAQMAGIAGFPHRFVSSFNGNFLGLIQRNAEMGECRANFCGELDAWEQVQKEAVGASVFFVGDECFGWTDCRLQNVQDVLASIPIQRAGVLSNHANCIRVDALGSGYDDEILGMATRAVEKDLHNTKDFLYLDQRIGNVIMPWRELFGGRSIPLRNPLLDKDVLDFMTHLPSSLRRGKKLYKETVRMMFPDLFRVKRAYKPAMESMRAFIDKERASIEKALYSGSSMIDPWIHADSCAALLQHATGTGHSSIKKKFFTFGKRLLKENTLAQSLKVFFSPNRQERSDPIAIVVRIMTLRCFLQQSADEHIQTSCKADLWRVHTN